MVYYKACKDDTVHLIKDSKSIIEEIHKYIQTRYGNKCLEKAKVHFKRGSTIANISDDTEFDEGIFYIKLDDNTYEMYKKTTKYIESGVIFSYKTSLNAINKIRVYGLIQVH